MVLEGRLTAYLFPHFLFECLKVGGADFSNAEEIQPCQLPGAEVIPALRLDVYVDFSTCRRPDKQIDEFFSPLVDNCCDRPLLQDVDSTPNQHVSSLREIGDRRRIIQLPVKPWFYGVLITGSAIDQMRNHQRPGVVRDGFSDQFLVLARGK